MDNATKIKIFRIIFGSILVVALIVITIVQFRKYLNEETNMSIQYENNYWIESSHHAAQDHIEPP